MQLITYKKSEEAFASTRNSMIKILTGYDVTVYDLYYVFVGGFI